MKVATLNLRNNSDRWHERFPLVVRQLLQEAPDIIAFQEVALSISQAEIIANAVNQQIGKQFYRPHIVHGWGPESTLGEAILSRYEPVGYEETKLPEGGRVAQVLHVWEGQKHYSILNTHLHHLPKDEERIRLKQIKFLMRWISKMETVNSAWLLVGDFNAIPKSKTIQLILEKFSSAYLSFHGIEPEYTFPTPLVEDKGGWNTPRTIDYIFFSPLTVKLVDAHLAFTDVDPNDSTLFASDHYGLVATFF